MADPAPLAKQIGTLLESGQADEARALLAANEHPGVGQQHGLRDDHVFEQLFAGQDCFDQLLGQGGYFPEGGADGHVSGLSKAQTRLERRSGNVQVALGWIENPAN